MALAIGDLSSVIPGCCDISGADIAEFSSAGQDELRGVLPEVKTVIVIGHHVRASLEWVWFPFETERNGTTCAADLHAKAVVEKLSFLLTAKGFKSAIVPYPGRCGIRFKDLARTAGMGQVGDSFLILHPAWGPWVHLRALLTDAEVGGLGRRQEGEVCMHCGKCISACPGKAIGKGTFNGPLCGETQLKTAEGTDRSIYGYKCEACARACPVGVKPPAASINPGSRPKTRAKKDNARGPPS